MLRLLVDGCKLKLGKRYENLYFINRNSFRKNILGNPRDYNWDLHWDAEVVIAGEKGFLPEDQNKPCLGFKKSWISNREQWSEDGSIKWLWESHDYRYVETVYIPLPDRKTYNLCISSQAGCSMKCKMCETAQYTYQKHKNLESDKLYWLAMVTKILAELYQQTNKKNLSLDEIAFMGMGEPLFNYENVVEAIKKLNSDGYETAISTIGIEKQIIRLSEEQFDVFPRLQISVHKMKNRRELIPIDAKEPIQKIIKAAEHYAKKTNIEVVANYVLLVGINDSEEEASLLGQALNPRFFRLNLTTYVGDEFVSCSRDEKERFASIVQEEARKRFHNDLEVYNFEPKGEGIKGACGQLVGKFRLDSHDMNPLDIEVLRDTVNIEDSEEIIQLYNNKFGNRTNEKDLQELLQYYMKLMWRGSKFPQSYYLDQMAADDYPTRLSRFIKLYNVLDKISPELCLKVEKRLGNVDNFLNSLSDTKKNIVLKTKLNIEHSFYYLVFSIKSFRFLGLEEFYEKEAERKKAETLRTIDEALDDLRKGRRSWRMKIELFGLDLASYLLSKLESFKKALDDYEERKAQEEAEELIKKIDRVLESKQQK